MRGIDRNNRFYGRPNLILWGIAWGVALLALLQCTCPDSADQTISRVVCQSRYTAYPIPDTDVSQSDTVSYPEKNNSSGRQEGIQYDYGFCPNDHGIVTDFQRTFRTAPSSPLKHVKREGSRSVGGLSNAEQMVYVCRCGSDRALLIPTATEPLYLLLQFFRN